MWELVTDVESRLRSLSGCADIGVLDIGSGRHDIGSASCFPLRSHSGNMVSTVKQVAGCDIHTEHSPLL